MKKPTKAEMKRRQRLFIQFVEYLVGGGVWFWSGYILIVLLDNHIGLFWANLIGNAVGITLNFLIQYFWAFRTKRKTSIELTAGRYVVYTLLNAFLLNYLILKGLRDYLGLPPEIGQFIASGFFTIWNYIWYKLWVFPEKEHPAKTRPRVRRIHKHLTTRH